MKSDVIYCGVNTERFSGEPLPAARGLRKLLYIGRLAEDKGVMTALRAMALVRGRFAGELRIYGRGDPDYTERLHAFAREQMKLVSVPEKQRPAGRNILCHQLLLPGWLRRQGIDVLHVPSYRRMVFSALCATMPTVHDLAPFHVAGKYDKVRMLYGRVVAKRLAHRQNALIAISDTTARDIERFFGVPAARVTVIHQWH